MIDRPVPKRRLVLHPGEHEIIEICGIRYDMQIFQHIGLGPIGSRIELISRPDDGTVTIRRLPDKPPLTKEEVQAAIGWLKVVAEPSNFHRSKGHAQVLLQILESLD